MIDIQITRLVAAAVAAFLLAWACYVTAFVKHRNDIRDMENRILLEGSALQDEDRIRVEKVKTWYFGYRLALLGLYFVALAIGWCAAWAFSQDHAVTWIEDASIAALASVIGGLILDKYIIHPIADGKFFDKVEDPLVDFFLENGCLPSEKMTEAPAEEPVPEAEKDPFDDLTFDEKVALMKRLQKKL